MNVYLEVWPQEEVESGMRIRLPGNGDGSHRGEDRKLVEEHDLAAEVLFKIEGLQVFRIKVGGGVCKAAVDVRVAFDLEPLSHQAGDH